MFVDQTSRCFSSIEGKITNSAFIRIQFLFFNASFCMRPTNHACELSRSMVYVCCVRLSEALTEPVIRHNFTKIPLPSKSFVFSQKLIQFYEVVLVYLNRTARSRKLRHSHSLTVLLREQTALICFTDVVTPS